MRPHGITSGSQSLKNPPAKGIVDNDVNNIKININNDEDKNVGEDGDDGDVEENDGDEDNGDDDDGSDNEDGDEHDGDDDDDGDDGKTIKDALVIIAEVDACYCNFLNGWD